MYSLLSHQSISKKSSSSTEDINSNDEQTNEDNQTDKFMYIQMEFCEKSTLR